MDTLNPLTLIDNLLADYIGPKGRRAVHSLILLAGLIVTVYLASGHNWEQALITLALSLYAEANRANTPAHDLDPAGEDSVPDDGDTYEEAGGQPYPGADADDAPVAPLVSGEPVVPTDPHSALPPEQIGPK